MTNMEKYKKIFIDIFEVDSNDLNDDFNFKDNEKWDSLAHLSLIASLEDTYEIMLDTIDILNYGSYRNGINILKKYGVQFEE